MEISQARADDVAELARLLHLDHLDEEPYRESVEAFAVDLAECWAARRDSHRAFVARAPGKGLVGMAWVALVARVPRPGATNRMSADIQTVFVLPEYRGQGIGSALVQAAAHYAEHLGVLHVTVHSGRRSVPVYERLGFNSFIATAIATPATLKSVATSTRPGGAKTHSRVHNFSDDGRHRVEMRATTRRRSLRLRLCCQATPAAAVEAMRNHFAHPDSWNGNLRR